MSKMFLWTQGRNYGKSQFFKQMEEEMRMSRGKEVPIEKRKEDPAIYNPENLSEDVRWGRMTPNQAREKIGMKKTELCKTAAEWRHDKLVKQDQYGSVFDIQRYNYLRSEPDAVMSKEEWEIIFNPIHEPLTCEESIEPEVYVVNTGEELGHDKLVKQYLIGEAYDGVIEELSETYVKKNADYGNSFEKTLDKRGLIPAIVRMEEKMERMEKLWETEKTLVDDESIIDTVMDLANYAIMTAMWLKKTVPGLSKNNVDITAGTLNANDFSDTDGRFGDKLSLKEDDYGDFPRMKL